VILPAPGIDRDRERLGCGHLVTYSQLRSVSAVRHGRACGPIFDTELHKHLLQVLVHCAWTDAENFADIPIRLPSAIHTAPLLRGSSTEISLENGLAAPPVLLSGDTKFVRPDSAEINEGCAPRREIEHKCICAWLRSLLNCSSFFDEGWRQIILSLLSRGEDFRQQALRLRCRPKDAAAWSIASSFGRASSAVRAPWARRAFVRCTRRRASMTSRTMGLAM